MRLDRRDFMRLSAAGVAGAVGAAGRAAAQAPLGGTPFADNSTNFDLPLEPAFKTKHAVMVIYGNGARKKDTIDNPALAPEQARIAKEGTTFIEDFGETANLHGYMYTELLTGRDAPSQRPRFPTWNEYIRKNTGEGPTKFWMVQPSSYYRAWTWDCKNFSKHPEYGPLYGATSLTMNKLFYEGNKTDPRVLVDETIEAALGHSAKERADIADFLKDVIEKHKYLPPSTKTPLVQRNLQISDAMCFQIAIEVLKTYRPRLITIQMLALDDAHADHGYWNYDTDFEEYLQHIKATDELVGRLWDTIQKDPYLKDTTALILRPECGRDDEVNIYGQLNHSAGNYYAHYVWSVAAGPDFKKGLVVKEKVNRRDFCPTLVYAMSGGKAPYATGHVRTQMFRDEFQLPKYIKTANAKVLEPAIDLEKLHLQKVAFNAAKRTRVFL